MNRLQFVQHGTFKDIIMRNIDSMSDISFHYRTQTVIELFVVEVFEELFTLIGLESPAKFVTLPICESYQLWSRYCLTYQQKVTNGGQRKRLQNSLDIAKTYFL